MQQGRSVLLSLAVLISCLLLPGSVLADASLLNHLATAKVPEQLLVNFSWAGYSHTHPEENYSLKLSPVAKQYQVSGKRQIISYGDPKASKSENVDLKLPQTDVTALLKVVDQAPWSAVKEAVRVTDHTDDYPYFSVAFTLAPAHKIKLFSNSNTRNFVPWNLSIDEQIYSSSDKAVGIAVLKLFSELRQTDKAK